MQRTRGFSLIEVMIAVAIFAVVAAIAYRGLGSVVRTRAALQETEQKLHSLTRALNLLEKDLSQAQMRSIRSGAGVLEPALLGDASSLRVSTLAVAAASAGVHFAPVRVQHVFGPNRWLRSSRAVLDAAPNTAESTRIQLESVSRVELSYFDQNLQPSGVWPPAAARNDPNFDLDTLPRAVELRFTVPGAGQIRRLILISDALPEQERPNEP
jgi:general secretion pathway protein J